MHTQILCTDMIDWSFNTSCNSMKSQLYEKPTLNTAESLHTHTHIKRVYYHILYNSTNSIKFIAWHTHIYIYIYVYTHIYNESFYHPIHLETQPKVYSLTHTYMYIYICIHTHIYVCTVHTYIQWEFFSSSTTRNTDKSL